MSNQSKRQESVRSVTGTTSTYEGDWHALFDLYSIEGTTFNERLLGYLNEKMGQIYKDLPSAQSAFAISNGVSCWNELGEFDAEITPP